MSEQHHSKPVSAWPRTDLAIAGLMGALHLLVSAFYGLRLGVSNIHPVLTWDYTWQSIPVSLLRERPWESLWYHHAQPPLWNLMGALLLRLFPVRIMESIQIFYVMLGAAMAAMVYLIVRQTGTPRKWALPWALVIGLNPTTFLYEAYHLYTLPVAFLVVSSVFALAWHQQTRSGTPLVMLAMAFNGLVLMRSLFSIVLLPAMLALVLILARAAQRRHIIILCLALCIPSIGWYAKNQVVFGFFGASSWSGLSLWKMATWDHTPDEIRELGKTGVIDDVVTANPDWFIPPDRLAGAGYSRQSHVPVLARNDYNNVNIPEIGNLYGRNAKRVIRHAPQRYAYTAAKAYIYFCRPSARFKHLDANRAKISLHERLYSDLFLGAAVMGELGTWLLFILPLALIAYTVEFANQLRQNGLREAVRKDAPVLWCYFLIMYVLAVSSLMEISENHRFKYPVEALIWIWGPVVISRLYASVKNRRFRFSTGPFHWPLRMTTLRRRSNRSA